jgi:hypothetical protein
MKRETTLAGGITFLLAVVPALLGQDANIRPSPAAPSDIVGAQLVAWSEVQKPQPLSQVLSGDRPDLQPDQQSAAWNQSNYGTSAPQAAAQQASTNHSTKQPSLTSPRVASYGGIP